MYRSNENKHLLDKKMSKIRKASLEYRSGKLFDHLIKKGRTLLNKKSKSGLVNREVTEFLDIILPNR